jgi:hypothetical protein
MYRWYRPSRLGDGNVVGGHIFALPGYGVS